MIKNVNLLIVESPTKARTLAKFLGKNYQIAATGGHIRDLPKKELGVDTKHDFAPEYVVMLGKKRVIAELKKAAQVASQIYLATDPDREGEAIAYHIFDVLHSGSRFKVQDSRFLRIVFHEITQKAIEEALKNPRSLDLNLIDAYQARRVLDRLVGYKLSPLLWRKVARGLSAGRVQSVTVRLIVEREKEREKFIVEPYFTIEAEFQTSNKQSSFWAKLFAIDGEKIEVLKKLQLFADEYAVSKTIIETKDEAEKLSIELRPCDYKVTKIERKEIHQSPPPPFTTATLQQAAANLLGFAASRTMRAAQRLYEEGLITYHRTDSVNLSSEFIASAREFIKNAYGVDYLPREPRRYQTKSKVAQEAHEAIRVTNVSKLSEVSELSKLSGDEEKLYRLIWQRSLASQAADAIFERVTVEIEGKRFLFKATGSILKFAGFKMIIEQDESVEREETLPPLNEGENLQLRELLPKAHQTQPPPRYTEAGLIKTLEKYGIGRPSTYAPIISTIQERNYVTKEERVFKPTEVGVIVNDLLVENFTEVVDLNFTAQMENDLDGIANGTKKWVEMVRAFYEPFEAKLESKEVELKKQSFNVLQKIDEKCPQCGSLLVVKLSRFGKFISCGSFPSCKYGRPFVESTAVVCPECRQGELVIRRTRRGKKFYGCGRYPECKYATWEDPRKGKSEIRPSTKLRSPRASIEGRNPKSEK